MNNDTPPWEDITAETMTEAEMAGYLLQRVAELTKRIDVLEKRLNSISPDKAAGDTLSAGAHKGKTRDACVEKHPDYVCYLADNGWAAKWGFTEDQVKRARDNPLLAALQRARR